MLRIWLIGVLALLFIGGGGYVWSGMKARGYP
jgi:hypothetical protein